MLVSVKSVQSIFSHQQTRMGVMKRNEPPINDWMIAETAKIVKSAHIRLKMVRLVNSDAMPTIK